MIVWPSLDESNERESTTFNWQLITHCDADWIRFSIETGIYPYGSCVGRRRNSMDICIVKMIHNCARYIYVPRANDLSGFIIYLRSIWLFINRLRAIYIASDSFMLNTSWIYLPQWKLYGVARNNKSIYVCEKQMFCIKFCLFTKSPVYFRFILFKLKLRVERIGEYV